MRKIPTLFTREFVNHCVVATLPDVTPGCEVVLQGKTTPTIKYDGACCAMIGGELYKRYDAKRGKNPPKGAIPCCDPDPVTGHWPHWIKCEENSPADKWFFEARKNSNQCIGLEDATYEAIGPHFQGNPYNLEKDVLVKHGDEVITKELELNFEGIRSFLENANIEGIVFWKDGEPVCKIKRRDFGFAWPIKKGVENEIT